MNGIVTDSSSTRVTDWRFGWLRSVRVSLAVNAEPSSDLSHDLVDLERLQTGRFLFQLHTPCNQDLARFMSVLTRVVVNDQKIAFSSVQTPCK